jgi:arylsulfatase A-like enzyme
MKFMKSLFFLAAMFAANALADSKPTRPNIVFIMSDDHASHAISAYGSKINKTPNIDRIGKEGMRFNNCFVVNSICTPSRAAILTGKYSHINGVTVFNRFDGSQWTYAKELKKAGYQTAMIGKWHLGSDPTGFDYWNILPGQGIYHDPFFIEMGERKKFPGYVTDLTTDFAIKWMDKRDKNKPFLVCVHHKAPHRPWEPDEKHAHMFEKEIPEPKTFNDNESNYVTRSDAAREAAMRIDRDLNRNDLKVKPPAGLKSEELQKWNQTVDTEMEVTVNGEKKKLSGQALKKWKYQRYMQDYLRCVASVDDNIGRLLDYLDKNSLRENTIVIYTSDQGFYLGDHDWYDKRFMYEESLRMPFLICYPAQIKAGSVNDKMILNVDFAPTFLEYAGLSAPKEVQGRSFVSLLHGRAPKDWRTTMYYRYYHYPGDHRVQQHYGVRSERYKLIYFNRLDQWEFYDLKRDPHELKNVYADAKYADEVKKLKAEMNRLRTELNDRDQLQDLQTQAQFDAFEAKKKD